jgi:hypothetical protein
MQHLEFVLKGLGFGVQALGFEVRVQGSGMGFCASSIFRV